MSDESVPETPSNISKGDFAKTPGETALDRAMSQETPAQARARIDALVPYNLQEIEALLKDHPRFERNLDFMVTQIRQNSQILAALLYQARGTITIDRIPQMSVKGDEQIQCGVDANRRLVLSFAPKLVKGV